MEVKIAKQARPAVGVLWSIGYIDVANADASRILDSDQWEHMRQQIVDLGHHKNPRISESQYVVQIGDFYELKDKGGILGKMSIRLFFAVFDEEKMIVVLGCHKKGNEDQTPRHIVTKIRNRMRQTRLALENRRKGG